MNDISDLSHTIVPKSDQLNADDLLVGSINLTIKGMKSGPVDQPVHIYSKGRQPYKPCKSMRRVLITAWGSDGKLWVGKSMTLFCEPTVKWGGVALGGIRISHLTDIERTLKIMLTISRGRKQEFIVHPLIIDDINIRKIADECGWTEKQVCDSFDPPLDSIDQVADKAACAKFLNDNKVK